MKSILNFCCISVLLLAASISNSQTLLYQRNGTSVDDYFGYSVSGAGDVNGDGKPDFLVGAYLNFLCNGYAKLYSGQNGQLLYTFTPPDTDPCLDICQWFGFSAAIVGDMNSNGKSEVVVGRYYYNNAFGSACVYSDNGTLRFNLKAQNTCGCATGAACRDTSWWFGRSVAGIGEINGDGKSDFIIGAPRASPNGIKNAGSAFIYSGADSTLICRKDGTQQNSFFGAAVAGIGKANNDTFPDFAIGAYNYDGFGAVYVYSGAGPNYPLHLQKFGTASGGEFGWSVAGIGDVNGDNKSDFIVGAPRTNSNKGRAIVYSGLNGNLLQTIDGATAGDSLGYSVSGGADVDGDGGVDVIVGAPGRSSAKGTVYVYSSSGWEVIAEKSGAANGDGLGVSVSMSGDMNGDGRAEFVVGAPYASPGGVHEAGSAYVYYLPEFPPVPRVNGNSIPDVFSLDQNYPNPFNPATSIQYRLAEPSNVDLKIFNILGQEVVSLVNEFKGAGQHQVAWDGKDQKGRLVPAGIYIYKIQAGDFVQSKKMLLLK
ncbi:MAG: FG-GAP-like repeat-containing protein [candidate division Zixibacteria bacterium]|nr:FG-GAP-like repeat-containing protein [candidate division Zixibacteria bacterium]